MNHPCSTSIYPCILVTVSKGEKVKNNRFYQQIIYHLLMCFIQHTGIFDRKRIYVFCLYSDYSASIRGVMW